GERQMAADNRLLGQFDLEGIPPAPRNTPQIEVEFSLDANGILTVSATEKATNKSADIKITNSGGLSDDEIEKMKADAEAHAADDAARRELVDAKNKADQMVHQTRQQLEEHGDKVSGETRSKIESSVSNLEAKLKGDDAAPITAAMTELEQSVMELGKAIYENAGAAGEAAAEGGESESAGNASENDDVIDAEYEVKDDDNKPS
ncbi:MAG: Hsp70 family protein, partial [Planctomycetota bacterium]